MPRQHALHRRQPGKGQVIGKRLHAYIRIDQDVQFMRGNLLPRLFQRGLQHLECIDVRAYRAGNLILLGRHHEGEYLEMFAIQAFQNTAKKTTNGMCLEELGGEADANFSRMGA